MALGGSSGSGSGSFRLRTGSLYAVAGIKPIGGFGRHAAGTPGGKGGQFIGAETAELYDFNYRLAVRLQREVAAALERNRVGSRRDVSSGRLAEAILDKNNRVVRNSGFGVGVPEFLDHSQAKYWRQIETGTSIHVGQRIPIGVWGQSLTGGYRNAPSGAYPIAGGSITGYGANRSGRLRPMGPTYAYRALVGAGYTKRAAYELSRARGTIRKAIAGEHYFEEGWRTFDAPRQVKTLFREEIRDFIRKGLT